MAWSARRCLPTIWGVEMSDLGSFAFFRPSVRRFRFTLNSGHISVESVGCFECRRARHEDNEELAEETNGFRHRPANGRRFLEGHQGSRGARFHPCVFYDTQMLSADCFVAMGAAAVKTRRIRLGTGVLVPSNRIAPVAANALATLN